jgi:16S rRNA (guanine527-N7)-methyltransferase
MVSDTAECIWKYFEPESDLIRDRVEILGDLYRKLNQNINVISRKDIDLFYLHHVLHSLALAKYNLFKPGQNILDLGTGGGFPGIPLAIFYPDCQFTLIDGTRKKIIVVNSVIEQLQLTNVEAIATRAEEFEGSFDYLISRAVSSTYNIWHWGKKLVKNQPLMKNQRSPRFLLLKGGDLHGELLGFHLDYMLQPIQQYFEETYFKEKYILAF